MVFPFSGIEEKKIKKRTIWNNMIAINVIFIHHEREEFDKYLVNLSPPDQTQNNFIIFNHCHSCEIEKIKQSQFHLFASCDSFCSLEHTHTHTHNITLYISYSLRHTSSEMYSFKSSKGLNTKQLKMNTHTHSSTKI